MVGARLRAGSGARLAQARARGDGRDEIISIIRPDNAASIKVATALGAERAETVEFFGAPSVIYRYPRGTR